MKRYGTGSLLRLTFLLLLVTGIAEAETMTYTDKLGRAVTLNVPLNRVVVFQTYELIPALEIWDKVVGLGREAYDSDLMRATKPDLSNTVPAVGTGADVNIEVLLKLKPDAVITWAFKPDSVKFMEERGLKVICVSPESLPELYQVMRLYGQLFGKAKRVDVCVAHMEEVFSLVKKHVSDIPSHGRRKVLWLTGKPTTVTCGLGVTSDLIRMIGGINPASSILQTSANVSMEQIVSWDPDIIFIWGYAGYRQRALLRALSGGP